ncbi:FapA family protein [Pseudodesulfovibrio thermohalotolerans]|uniref:DUF342 domain-containing protein n=1 Tax=Pseudodesulfovibrio thermohalotolerans TaxID=2880651 RepID=UPI002442E1B8|nr:FapA family protein [Pseudodesulfovibrio thermohalotolerans]WFS64237.1 FapA family protein [Pseudodesulfovibrio thermohalotolerans]
MPFFLKHYFDPDWDPAKLKPEEQADGSVDHHERQFVKNVSAGDLIAEWLPLEEAGEELDERFVFEEKAFPAGRGTGIRRESPDKLFAAVDGYVCYKEGRILVRNPLTVHSDIDYHTGNVDFVGSVVVEGAVRTGFSVEAADDVRVNAQIEGAAVTARGNLDCRGGVKGGKEAILRATKDMRLAFCEYATLLAGGDILVKGALMHSDAYAGKRLAVGGRLTGGSICAYKYIYVGGQLGGGMDTDTSLILGYQPTLLYADQRYNQRIKVLHEDIAFFEKALNRGEEFRAEYEPRLESARSELELLKDMKVELWDGIYATERLDDCRVLVPGVVRPGVEICIGSAYYRVDDFLEDVFFYYDNGEVKYGASTGKMKK